MKFNVKPLDTSIKAALIDKVNNKTKPLGALGALEAIAIQVGLVQQSLSPALNNASILVFAADHGIANHGVSAYPQAVTAQMVSNFLSGGAAINVFTKQHSLGFTLVDAGVNATLDASPHLIDAKMGLGTKSFLNEPAMSLSVCEQAIIQGAHIMDNLIVQGCNTVGFGEMGIANTAAASCLMSVINDAPIAQCVGRGTGLDDAGLTHKSNVLKQAIDFHQLHADDDITTILATFGGFEIAMMVGAMLRAAEKQCVLLIDGFIVSAALLVASRFAPNILDYCIFSHCSEEQAHKALLAHFRVEPLLQLNMRLGEGSGVALAYPLVQSAVNFLNEMASFADANVSQQT